MNLRLLISGVALSGLCLGVQAQTVVKPAAKITNTSFAVITDTPTWRACAGELQNYCDVLAGEQLPTFIVHHDWKSPEEVKKVIKNLYKKHKLEGVVFVGDIPVPMIRKAQHMTSAFKMDEEKYPFRDSSVPSDRFYDDFDLKFDFLKQDKEEPAFFYYDLAADSPQQIKCEIYSARVKPIENGEAPHEQIKKFFNKAVKEHKSGNRLDQFFSYTGEGSYSNSLTAWTQEALTIRQQMPGTFDSPTAPGRARFMRYNFSDYPKEDVMSMLRREDLDLSIFHEHGMPERQYLSGTPEVEYADDAIDLIKEYLRYMARRCKGDSARLADFSSKYAGMGLDSTWWAGYDKPETIKADSLSDLRRGLVLTDITETAPNSRMVIFDACYNGDFREPDNIAARYIFSDGKCVATFANSVNVLQDKQANELLGLLWLGGRVGNWAQETNILESHIIGDPTFRFAPSYDDIDITPILSRPYNEKAELELLKAAHPDVRSLAMHRLWRHGYKGLSPILLEVYRTSPAAMERYTAISLLEKLGDANFDQVLAEAVNDPNEFIRRKAANWMGRVGHDEYVPVLVDAYFADNQSARVAFNIEMILRAFSSEAVDKALAGKSGELADKLRKAYAYRAESDSTVLDKNASKTWRIAFTNSLRNNNIHASLPEYIALMEDPAEDEELRIAMIKALAWYDKSYRRNEIMAACDRLRKSSGSSKAIKEEARRTYFRLK